MVINADYDGTGDGTLTVAAGKVINTNEGTLTVTAWDLDLQGTLQPGTETLVIHPAEVATSQTIGLGDTARDMHITDAELGRMSGISLTIGSSEAGSITVDNVSDENSGNVGTITLMTTRSEDQYVLFDTQPSSFNKGIIVQAAGGVFLSQNVTTTNDATVLFAGEGEALDIDTDIFFSSTNQLLTVTADDAIIDGSISTGDAALHMTCSSLGGSGLGLTMEIGAMTNTQEFKYNYEEISRTTANGLYIGGGNCYRMTVGRITEASSNNIAGIVSLVSNRDGGKVTFFSTASTFNSVAVQADEGVVFQKDISTTGASMYLDGDIDDSSTDDNAFQDASVIAATDGRTISAKTLMTLEASTISENQEGSIFTEGNLTFEAGSGIVFLDSLVAVEPGANLVISTDYDSSGDGTLTISDAKYILSNDATTLMTAWDVDIEGGINNVLRPDAEFDLPDGYVGNLTYLIFHASFPGQTIALGDNTAGDMQISDTELGRLTTGCGVNIGSSTNGVISVDGLTTSNTDTIGTLTLIATDTSGSRVDFIGSASSFNKGIVAQAGSGIVFEQHVTTEACTTTLSSGEGTLTIVTPRKLITSGQQLMITADDMNINGFIDATPSGVVVIECGTNGNTVGLGRANGQLSIDGNELTNIAGGGLSLGGTTCGNTAIDEILSAHSDNIDGIFTIMAQHDDSSVVFSNRTSTFNHLAVMGDNGVRLLVPLNTDTGGLFLDGDYEDSSSSDSSNDVFFISDLTFTAKTLLTLESTMGLLVPQGPATMRAGTGVSVEGDLLGQSVASPLVINADYELVGDGTFTIAAGRTVTSNDSELTVTAWDVDLAGSVDSGTAATNIHVSTPLQTIGLGATSVTTTNATDGSTITTDITQNMHIEDIELQRITSSGGLTIGGDEEGSVSICDVSATGTGDVTGIISIFAAGDDSQMLFHHMPSEFSSAAAQADNGVLVKVDLTTVSGIVYLDGDTEDSSTQDGLNTVGFTDGRTVTAKLTMTLESTTGFITPAGDLTLTAGAGVVMLDNLFGQANDKTLVINADYESGGDGTFTVAAGKTLTSNDSDMVITAWDIDMQGGLASGVKGTQVHGAQPGQTVGIGFSSRDMHITGDEMQKITTTGGLRLGGEIDGNMVVSGVTGENSMVDILSLVALNDDAQVIFSDLPSTFNALAAQADNGIAVQADITTTLTGIFMDGDADDSATSDADNNILIANATTLSSEMLITLAASTGLITPEGYLTLQAGAGVVILDSLTALTDGSGALVIDADHESAGDGTLTVYTGKVITTGNSELVISAWDMAIDGALDSGTSSMIVHAAAEDQTFGLGATAKDMHISDEELGRLTTTDRCSIGSSTSGAIAVDSITEPNSNSAAVTLIATQEATVVTFLSGASTFNKGITIQAMGGTVLSESARFKESETIISTGTGTLTVQTTKVWLLLHPSRYLTCYGFAGAVNQWAKALDHRY